MYLRQDFGIFLERMRETTKNTLRTGNILAEISTGYIMIA
jgi:hypothetical protein